MNLLTRARSLFLHAKKSVYVRNIGWLVRGNFIAHLIQILALPLISRLYSPDEFGVFSLFLAFIGFSSIAVTLRLDSAILIADDKEVSSLAVSSLFAALLLSIFFTALFVLFQQYALMGFEIVPSWAPFVIFITLIGHGFFNTGRALLLRKGDVRAISKARVEKSFGNVLTKLGIGFSELGVAGLLLGEMVGAWLAFRCIGKSLLKHFLSGIDKYMSKGLEICIRYKKFAIFELPSILINQAALMLPIPMLVIIGGAKVAGAYGMARMIVALPNAQIGRAIADGFQWKTGEMVRRKETNRLMSVLLKTGASLAALGFIPYVLLVVFSPWAFPLFLGDDWALSGTIAAMLSVSMYLALIVSPLSRLLSVLKKQELKLIYDFFILIMLFVLYFYALSTDMSSLEFIFGMVVVYSVGYLLYACIIIFACRKFTSDQTLYSQ